MQSRCSHKAIVNCTTQTRFYGRGSLSLVSAFNRLYRVGRNRMVKGGDDRAGEWIGALTNLFLPAYSFTVLFYRSQYNKVLPW